MKTKVVKEKGNKKTELKQRAEERAFMLLKSDRNSQNPSVREDI